jgi:hypothetical protein
MMDVRYLWVIEKRPTEWLVSNWDEQPYWLHIAPFVITPDFELSRDGTHKQPVRRRIGCGEIGQYHRFSAAGER